MIETRDTWVERHACSDAALSRRVATSAVTENQQLVNSSVCDMTIKQNMGVLEQERQTNLQEMSNLLQALARTMVTRGPEAASKHREEDTYAVIHSSLISPLTKLAVRCPCLLWGEQRRRLASTGR